jgi:hypothetical protein
MGISLLNNIHDEIPLIASYLQYWLRFPQNQLFEWNELSFSDFYVKDAEIGLLLLDLHSWCNFTHCIISPVLGQIFREFTFWVKWAEFFEFQGLRCWNGDFVAKHAFMTKFHWLHHLFTIGSDFRISNFLSEMSWLFLNFDVSDAEIELLFLNMHLWQNFTDCIIFSPMVHMSTESTFWVKWAKFFEFWDLLHYNTTVGSDFHRIHCLSEMS